MQISEFAFRIILIFIPGIITCVVVDSLTFHKKTTGYGVLLKSLMLGFLCYLLYFLLTKLGLNNGEFHFVRSLSDKAEKLDFTEISFVTLLSLPVGLLVTYFINYKILHHLAHSLRVSRKFGDLDVWSYLMNSRMEPWVVVRDLAGDLIYEGWIEAFSESSDETELFLRDVKVYRNSTGEELYDTPSLYLAKKRETLTVEFSLVDSSGADTAAGEE